jgi:hypothetical protein
MEMFAGGFEDFPAHHLRGFGDRATQNDSATFRQPPHPPIERVGATCDNLELVGSSARPLSRFAQTGVEHQRMLSSLCENFIGGITLSQRVSD